MKKIIITIIIFAAFAGAGYLAYQKYFFGFNPLVNANYDKSCITAEKENIVRGNSLQGVINNGETVKILKGYYDCNPIQREDIIAYDFSGNPEPIIKIIKAVPKDAFSLKSDEKGNYNIIVNDRVLTVSSGQPYELSESGSKMLSLYINDYKGVIPEDTYLILGNQVGGSLDSTKFGLVNKKGIIGRVIRK